MNESGNILTIGQGARTIDELIGELRAREVAFLIDVRSSPRSGYRPEFSREPLDARLREEGIRYVFMGELLGGRPDDPSCYVNGKVDYAACREKDFFLRGIGRLKKALGQGLTVCLMCSEGHPGQCHRSKLIGVALTDEGIELQHILPDGEVATQDEILRELTGGQSSLFGEAFQSRRAYSRSAGEA